MGLVDVKGLQKTSLVDFPPFIASTVFVGRCNFRCPFCHNPDLVLGYDGVGDVSEEELFAHLISRKGIVDGVCISGGEPTLYKGLPGFIKKIKDLGFLVKLDTNGSNPEMLKFLIGERLVDYVAMDIKASKDKYVFAAGTSVDLGKVCESVELLKMGSVDYEFRTTFVPGLISKEDVIRIGLWLEGSEKFFVQQFVSSSKLLNKEFENMRPFNVRELEEFSKVLSGYIKKVEIRGV